MILFPAVDIKGGQAVRLRRGRADDSTVFSDDPVAAALQWQEQGAKFLHLVDLDGAFEGVSPNTDLVRRICEALSIPVQLGGGIRDEETAHRWLDAGVARLIIGTLALEDPARFAALCHACPGRIGVSVAGWGIRRIRWMMWFPVWLKTARHSSCIPTSSVTVCRPV